MRVSILGGDCLHFAEKLVIFLNSCVFLILTRKIPIDDPQGCAHIFKDALELTANFADCCVGSDYRVI